jgi:aspartate aminotransferase
MEGTFIESAPMLKVSEMAENLQGSEIIKIANDINKKIEEGEKVYNFTIGDFDPSMFQIPEILRNEIAQAYLNDQTNYPPANGLQELRSAISRYLHTRLALEYNDDQILISSGARPLIYSIFKAVLDPEDKVLVPVPSWNNNHYTHLNYGTPVFIETDAEDNFLPTAEKLKSHIHDAKLITLCSPLNPTGTIFDRVQLSKICEMVIEENKKRGEYNKPVYVLFDQVYWNLIYGSNVHMDPVSLYPEMKNYTIFVDGISKSFAATGVRVGWGFGPLKLIKKMQAILSHIGAWAPKPEQVGLARFFKHDDQIDAYLEQFKGQIHERLMTFHNGFQDLKEEGFKVDAVFPQSSIYLTVQLNLIGMKTPEGERLSNATDISKFLLKEGSIGIVPFHAFGASKNSSWFRISVGTCKLSDIEGFFSNLKIALKKLV